MDLRPTPDFDQPTSVGSLLGRCTALIDPTATHREGPMTTAAQRRKDAEKIQKDALQSRLDAVQPLIDEVSKRETLADKLAAMQAEISDSDTTISTHYRAALDGGWTAKELAAAGLAVPKKAQGKRTTKPQAVTPIRQDSNLPA